MLNRIILIGRLTRDPELRYTPSGVAVTKFTLAVDRPYKNAQGERETDFIDCITWRQLAEIAANNLEKGRLVAVDGRLQVRPFTDAQGNKRRATEVVAEDVRFLDKKKNGDNSAPANSGGSLNGFGEQVPFNDEDIPF